MKNKIETARAAINRAGLVSINPPPGFLDRCGPALYRAIKASRTVSRYNPDSVAELANRCRGAAFSFNVFSSSRALNAEQREEIRRLAAKLNEAAAGIDGDAPVIVAMEGPRT